MSYDASSIRILEDTNDIPYVEIQRIVDTYGKPLTCVTKAYEACLLAGLGFREFYEEKYCKGKDIPFDENFNTIYNELE